MENQTLRQLQLLQLKILKEVKRICDTNQISYWLDAGTLLGAVRHQGVIPWDDDLDIGLLAEDYLRLKACVRSGELSNDFFWEDWETDPYYGFPYSKICLKGTEYIEEKNQRSHAQKAIFIDVFPYYVCAKTEKEQKKEANCLKIYTHMLLCKMHYEVWSGDGFGKWMKFIPIRIVSLFFKKRKLKEKIQSIFYKHMFKSGEEVYVGDGQNGGFWHFPRSWFQSLIDIPYEGEVFKVPERYQEYLKRAYGEYWKIPDEKHRTSHRIISLQFGKHTGKKSCNEI